MPDPRRPRNATGEHRQFDFWTGDWDAYGLDERNKLVARARVDVILDGCALLEVYEQLDGLNGQSFSIYDASRGTYVRTPSGWRYVFGQASSPLLDAN